MANSHGTRVLGLVCAVLWLASSNCLAQQGGPQIGRATADIQQSIRDSALGTLPAKVRECYAGLQLNADRIAYCFGLDYAASVLSRVATIGVDAEFLRYFTPEKVLTRANRALGAVKIEQSERGTLIAFWIKSFRGMLQELAKANKVDLVHEKVQRARLAALKLVRDPNSVRISDMKLSVTPNQRGEPTEVVCGKISLRANTGSYSVGRPFVYFVGDQSANYDSGSDDLDRTIVRNFCQE